jgi:hypothetical protein
MALPILDVTSLDVAKSYTGCNRVGGASFHVLRGAIELNSSRLDAAFALAHSSLHTARQQSDGIQSNGSFHQHGVQLYTGWGYGAIYSANVLVLESFSRRGHGLGHV